MVERILFPLAIVWQEFLDINVRVFAIFIWFNARYVAQRFQGGDHEIPDPVRGWRWNRYNVQEPAMKIVHFWKAHLVHLKMYFPIYIYIYIYIYICVCVCVCVCFEMIYRGECNIMIEIRVKHLISIKNLICSSIAYNKKDHQFEKVLRNRRMKYHASKLVQIIIFTQPLRSGRIWHKVNFLSGV